MINTDYWGKVYVILFIDLSRDEAQNNNLHIFLKEKQLIDSSNKSITDKLCLKKIENPDQLSQELLSLDDNESKTLHFISHGSPKHPGFLCKSNSEYLNVIEILKKFQNNSTLTR